MLGKTQDWHLFSGRPKSHRQIKVSPHNTNMDHLGYEALPRGNWGSGGGGGEMPLLLLESNV